MVVIVGLVTVMVLFLIELSALSFQLSALSFRHQKESVGPYSYTATTKAPDG
jgi:hypothetical protein